MVAYRYAARIIPSSPPCLRLPGGEFTTIYKIMPFLGPVLGALDGSWALYLDHTTRVENGPMGGTLSPSAQTICLSELPMRSWQGREGIVWCLAGEGRGSPGAKALSKRGGCGGEGERNRSFGRI